MARKNTVWGARHLMEEQEIKRIIEEYQRLFDITITKLEASAILAERSKDVFWSESKARDMIKRMRGL